MSDGASAQGLMRGFVEGRPGGNLKQKLGSAATALKWTHGRAKAVLYGEARRIEAHEMDQLRRAAAAKRDEEATHEWSELAGRLARMEEMLAALSAQMAGGAMDREGREARRAGPLDRA